MNRLRVAVGVAFVAVSLGWLLPFPASAQEPEWEEPEPTTAPVPSLPPEAVSPPGVETPYPVETRPWTNSRHNPGSMYQQDVRVLCNVGFLDPEGTTYDLSSEEYADTAMTLQLACHYSIPKGFQTSWFQFSFHSGSGDYTPANTPRLGFMACVGFDRECPTADLTEVQQTQHGFRFVEDVPEYLPTDVIDWYPSEDTATESVGSFLAIVNVDFTQWLPTGWGSDCRPYTGDRVYFHAPLLASGDSAGPCSTVLLNETALFGVPLQYDPFIHNTVISDTWDFSANGIVRWGIDQVLFNVGTGQLPFPEKFPTGAVQIDTGKDRREALRMECGGVFTITNLSTGQVALTRELVPNPTGDEQIFQQQIGGQGDNNMFVHYRSDTSYRFSLQWVWAPTEGSDAKPKKVLFSQGSGWRESIRVGTQNPVEATFHSTKDGEYPATAIMEMSNGRHCVFEGTAMRPDAVIDSEGNLVNGASLGNRLKECMTEALGTQPDLQWSWNPLVILSQAPEVLDIVYQALSPKVLSSIAVCVAITLFVPVQPIDSYANRLQSAFEISPFGTAWLAVRIPYQAASGLDNYASSSCSGPAVSIPQLSLPSYSPMDTCGANSQFRVIVFNILTAGVWLGGVVLGVRLALSAIGWNAPVPGEENKDSS